MAYSSRKILRAAACFLTVLCAFTWHQQRELEPVNCQSFRVKKSAEGRGLTPDLAAQSLPAADNRISALEVDSFRCRLAARHDTYFGAAFAASLYAAASSVPLAVALGHAAIGSYVALMRFPFSPIDETAHVTYIHYLAHNGVPPSARAPWPDQFPNAIVDVMGVHDQGHAPVGWPFYQGFQPPGGYAVGALVLRLLEIAGVGLATTFLALRVVGVLVVSVGLFLVAQAQRELATDVLHLDPYTAMLLTAALSISASFLSIMSVITNDQSCVLALGATAFVTAKLLRAPEKKKLWSWLGLAGALTWLCKLTWSIVPCLVVVAAFFAKPRRLARVVWPMSLLVGPWYVSNLLTYHQLTGAKAHLRAVLPALNPLHTRFSSVQILHQGLLDYFFVFFQAQSPSLWDQWLAADIGRILLLSILYGVSYVAWHARATFRQLFSPHESLPRPTLVVGACALVAVGPLLLTTMLTIKTGAWFILGRYGYAGIGILAALSTMALRSLGIAPAILRIGACGLLLGVANSTFWSTRELPFTKNEQGQPVMVTRKS